MVFVRLPSGALAALQAVSFFALGLDRSGAFLVTGRKIALSNRRKTALVQRPQLWAGRSRFGLVGAELNFQPSEIRTLLNLLTSKVRFSSFSPAVPHLTVLSSELT